MSGFLNIALRRNAVPVIRPYLNTSGNADHGFHVGEILISSSALLEPDTIVISCAK